MGCHYFDVLASHSGVCLVNLKFDLPADIGDWIADWCYGFKKQLVFNRRQYFSPIFLLQFLLHCNFYDEIIWAKYSAIYL